MGKFRAALVRESPGFTKARNILRWFYKRTAICPGVGGGGRTLTPYFTFAERIDLFENPVGSLLACG
jgi:hypothetical protein